jgi:aspartate-semialdehyde dehydrogenase
LFAETGAVVIDNSSRWRMDPDVPLVVPEVNPDALREMKKNIIANPNCSTIQAVVALKPLDDAFSIRRVVYSTYQAVSGAGLAGYEDLSEGIKGVPPKKFAKDIAFNVIPHIDVFLENGYSKEEEKMVLETRKILSRPGLRITATTVRVPVFHGHSECVNIEFERPCTAEGVRAALSKAPGVVVLDDPMNNVYPTPREIAGTDSVYVGRIRKDESVESGINIWVVADNIRKGAATNAVQILEALTNV